MGPYALSLIIVSLMDQPVQMVEVFTFPKKRSVQLSQTSVPRRYRVPAKTQKAQLLQLQGDQNCCLGVYHMKTTPFVQKKSCWLPQDTQGH